MNHKLVIIPNDFNERGQVDLIDFQSIPDEKYKWILNYQYPIQNVYSSVL